MHTAKGQYVTVELDDHFLTFRRKAFFASFSGGHRERRIPINQIGSVNFKLASRLFRGHFQILTNGGHAVHDPNPMSRGISIAGDPNAAVFYRKSNANFEALLDALYQAQIKLQKDL